MPTKEHTSRVTPARPRAKAKKPRPEGTPVSATHYSAIPMAKYLRPFVERGWPISSLAQACEVDETILRDVLDDKQKIVTAPVGRKLMMISRDLLMEKSSVIPNRETAWMIGSLMAVGHPLTHLARRLGYSTSLLNRVLTGKGVAAREVYEDVHYLHDDWSLHTGPCDKARQRAAARGFRHPDDYNPDGTLCDDHDEGDAKLATKFARRDHAAWARLETLRLTLRAGMGTGEISRRLKTVSTDLVKHYLDESGLTFYVRPSTTPGWPDRVMPEPGQEERLQQIREVLDRWDWDNLVDPYHLLRSLDMMSGNEWAALERAGRPELQALQNVCEVAA